MGSTAPTSTTGVQAPTRAWMRPTVTTAEYSGAIEVDPMTAEVVVEIDRGSRWAVTADPSCR